MKIYAYIEYLLLFLKLIMYKRKISFALIIIIDAKIKNRTNLNILNASAIVRHVALAFNSKEYSIL